MRLASQLLPEPGEALKNQLVKKAANPATLGVPRHRRTLLRASDRSSAVTPIRFQLTVAAAPHNIPNTRKNRRVMRDTNLPHAGIYRPRIGRDHAKSRNIAIVSWDPYMARKIAKQEPEASAPGADRIS
jgi:hypothetical protein